MSKRFCEAPGKKKKDPVYACKKCGEKVKQKDRVCKPVKIKQE